MSSSFLPEGSIILCRRGHEIAELSRDLHAGDLGYETALINWRVGQIIACKGDILPLLCSKCGAPYFIPFYFPWTKYPRISQQWMSFFKTHEYS